ncbi:MAG: hypothetical protein JSS62_01735 [Verrucomicrobia bacterium]|nr:hypothetical protein [Verrucomicrobiota bacterium]
MVRVHQDPNIFLPYQGWIKFWMMEIVPAIKHAASVHAFILILIPHKSIKDRKNL